MSEEQVLLSVLLEQPSSFCDPFQIILLREDRSGVEGGAASRADLVLQRPSLNVRANQRQQPDCPVPPSTQHSMEMAQELTTNTVGEGTSHTWYQGDWWAVQICPAVT